jgi:hypothetical protein
MRQIHCLSSLRVLNFTAMFEQPLCSLPGEGTIGGTSNSVNAKQNKNNSAGVR